MKKFVSLFLFAATVLFACTQSSHKVDAAARVPLSREVSAMLDSVIKNSDSTYSKPYKRTDFVTADYYVNKPGKTICQVMKDSSGNIRQIIISKNDIRTFFAQYYANGQLMAKLSLDSFGQYTGPAVYYYENGRKQNEGNYKSGFHTGAWNNYDEAGKLLSTDIYDSNGQRIPATNK